MGTTPDELRNDVEVRRAHLARNVDLLADRMAPRRIAQRRVGAVRRRLTSAKEHVMGSVNDTGHGVLQGTGELAGRVGDSAGQVADRIGDTVGEGAGQVAGAVQQAPEQVRRQTRGNPIAAGIIAFGAGMLAATLLPVSETEQRAGAQLREHADELVEPLKQAATQTVQEVKEELREPAQEAVESVRATAQEAVHTTTDAGRQAAQSTAEDLKQTGQDAARQVRDQAGE
ncbi:DUF3618 domain-containing protein [Kitasatospora sp. NPDC001540]|uniref:DUF3618 domain-containing protein n=1 Tax=Kitasatospora sp. NPDC001540 TaxID=3364014 RepID=UPI003695F10B